jgi:hypothetical protein
VYNRKIFVVAYPKTAPSDQFQFQFQSESPGLYDILENRKR